MLTRPSGDPRALEAGAALTWPGPSCSEGGLRTGHLCLTWDPQESSENQMVIFSRSGEGHPSPSCPRDWRFRLSVPQFTGLALALTAGELRPHRVSLHDVIRHLPTSRHLHGCAWHRSSSGFTFLYTRYALQTSLNADSSICPHSFT